MSVALQSVSKRRKGNSIASQASRQLHHRFSVGLTPSLGETSGRASNSQKAIPLGLAVCCLVMMLLTDGCRIVQEAANVPGKAVQAVTPGGTGRVGANPVVVQERLMRFADGYSTAMVYGMDKLRRGTNALDPAELLKWKIALGTETCSIATGPNAIGNLLDMTIFVTVTRMALQDYWQPKVFGESAHPLLESCRNAEKDIWHLAGQILTPAQLTELHRAIDIWFRENPLPESVLAARAVGFASEVAEANPADTAKPGSVFSLLKLDPLSGLDPATREIAQTRLLAERALYVSQKMPRLLRWQTELLSMNTVRLAGVQQLITNSTSLAASVDRVAGIAEKLPGQVSAERAEILKALQSQEKDVASLMSSGTQMSDSLNTTLTTFDSLMKRFGVGETNYTEAAPTNSEPFRIQDYTQTAAQLEATARQLTELLVTLDQTLGSPNFTRLSTQADLVIQRTQTGGKEIVDYAFWKGVLLLVILFMAALVYRVLASKFTVKARPNPD